MKKILFNTALLSFFLLSVSAAQAGIVLAFGNNVTAERQAALQAAATELEQVINFRQTVKISVSFDALQCDSFSGVLGQAGPSGAFSDFPGAPQNNVWYVSAQAADLGSTSAQAQTQHIGGSFNTNLGNTGCLDGITWYFGTDHNPGINQVDFLATAVHEFMHGLGFLSLVFGNNGQLNGGLIDNYSTFLLDNSTGKSWKNMTSGERAASILNDGNLVWNGAKTTAMNSLLQTGNTNGKVRLYAPSVREPGSSTSHFDIAVHYNSGADEVMEPYDAFPQESIMASAAFCDMGWTLLRDTDGDSVNDCSDVFPLDLTESADTDHDGVGDNADAFPNNPTETTDTDSDGVGDNADAFPTDPTESADTDHDGVGDNADAFPTDPTETTDTDNDGTGNNADAFPSNAAASADSDHDGKPDAWNQPNPNSCAANAPTCNGLTLDTDTDGDGVADTVDNCPLVANANQLDWDNDGIGNVCGDDLPMPGISGAASLDKAGSSVAFAGDADKDGYGDYVVGIPGYDIPATPTAKIIKDAGRAVVISGKTGLELMSVNGVATKDAMGTAVAGNGDIDNDGFDDVLVGAPNADDVAKGLVDAGSVTVLYGPDGSRKKTFFGPEAKGLAGSAVALGDVNNDGFADIIYGAPKDDNTSQAFTVMVDAGSVILRSGDPGTNNSLLKTIFGDMQAAYAGSSVAVGFVDAVAGADIIIGAPNDDFVPMGLKDAGSVIAYNFLSDTPIITKQYGAVAKAYLGKSVAAGDVDNNGRDDVIAGASGDDDIAKKRLDAGSVTVFFSASALQPLTRYGVSAKANLGKSVAVADVNGDGYAEVIAGAWKDDVAATASSKKIVDAGSVSIWSGLSADPVTTLHGAAAKDYFGAAVSAGDINSDGKSDLLIGISGDDIPGIKVIKDGGTVQIISGASL